MEALPPLRHDCYGIVAMFNEEVGHLLGQVLIHLYPDAHGSPCLARGMKSAWLTASAANFNAARMSSLVRWG